jgi:hypothetical protein
MREMSSEDYDYRRRAAEEEARRRRQDEYERALKGRQARDTAQS